MKILVDADACPVKKEIVKVAKELSLEVIMFVDNTHVLQDEYAQVVTVDKGRDSADFALVNKVKSQDIVVSQDYGVATMALAKGGHVLNQDGLIYTAENIDALLFQRYTSAKIRRSGGRTSGPKKRDKNSNEKFEEIFRKLCCQVMANQ